MFDSLTHNLQGDVVGILDMDGASVVDYGYDVCRMPTYTKGSMAETLGAGNPFRYRGVVWDRETGLYYLRSRYDEPNWCRFMNADTYAQNGYDPFSSNMFGYCPNNPVANAEIDGDVPYPAYIHNEITRYIASIYPNITAEVGFYKANGRIGRADLIDLDDRNKCDNPWWKIIETRQKNQIR